LASYIVIVAHQQHHYQQHHLILILIYNKHDMLRCTRTSLRPCLGSAAWPLALLRALDGAVVPNVDNIAVAIYCGGAAHVQLAHDVRLLQFTKGTAIIVYQQQTPADTLEVRHMSACAL
jgi:hypothetical protein